METVTANESGGEATTRIVIVEDDPDNLALLVALLGGRYDAAVCSDGRDALRTIIEHRPDLVLLDLGLPYLDGPTILELVRRQPMLADIPVIAVTADVRRDSEHRWLWHGFDGFIAKPLVDKLELWSKIDLLLGESQETGTSL
jgi:CheY-like chemotaxis protein